MKDMTSAMIVFLALAPRLTIDPPLTLCDEIAELWNRNLNDYIGVTSNGQLMVMAAENAGDLTDIAADSAFGACYWFATKDGWRDGQIWPQPLITSLFEACYRFGIPGVS